MLANLNQIPKSLPTTRHLGNKSEKSARVMDNWNTEAQMVVTWTVNVSHQQELFIHWTAVWISHMNSLSQAWYEFSVVTERARERGAHTSWRSSERNRGSFALKRVSRGSGTNNWKDMPKDYILAITKKGWTIWMRERFCWLTLFSLLPLWPRPRKAEENRWIGSDNSFCQCTHCRALISDDLAWTEEQWSVMILLLET